jgi:hypothetical protein
MSDPPAFRGNPDSSIVDQVSIIRRSEFNYQQVLTIGPKFGTADDRAAIAADFTKALEQLITQGRVNANGEFAANFKTLLHDAARRTVATTPVESELLGAARMTLAVTSN